MEISRRKSNRNTNDAMCCKCCNEIINTKRGVLVTLRVTD